MAAEAALCFNSGGNFSYCFACHTVDPDETAPLQGPKLIGVVGRPVASRDDYSYTEVMKAYGEGKIWTAELILQWTQDPQAMVPDTRMERPPGPRADEERAALIEYLKAH